MCSSSSLQDSLTHADEGNPVRRCPLCGRVGNGGHPNDYLGVLACTGLLGDDDGTPNTFSCLYDHLDEGVSPNRVLENALRIVFVNRISCPIVGVDDAISLIRSFLYGDMNHGVPEEGDHFWTGRQPQEEFEDGIEEIEIDGEEIEEETGFDDPPTGVADGADEGSSLESDDGFGTNYGPFWTGVDGSDGWTGYDGSSEESSEELVPDVRAAGA